MALRVRPGLAARCRRRRAVRLHGPGRASVRCSETAFLEFHHLRPVARGGRSTVENLELRCRAHNG